MSARIPRFRLNRMALAAAVLGLTGCVSVPMAPLVYGSKTVGGMDISSNTASANPGVSISIGYKRDDIALVPVAVMENKEQKQTADGKGGENVLIVRGDDRNSGIKCDTAELAKDATAKAACEAQRKSADSRKDSMSVFGSFEGRGMGGAQAASAQAVAANYFATGVAAQHLADGVGKAARVDQLRKCFQLVQDIVAGIPDADQPAYRKKGLAACSEAGQTPASETK